MAGSGNGSRTQGSAGKRPQTRKKVPGAREGRTNSYDTRKTSQVRSARSSNDPAARNAGRKPAATRDDGRKARTGVDVRTQTGRTRQAQTAQEPRERVVREEGSYERENAVRRGIYLVIAGLIAALCFVSYLGLCGKFGDIVNDITFGFMGSLTYVFPFALFGISAFYVFTGRKCRTSRVVYLVLLAVVITALLQLAIGGYEPGLKLLDNFTNSSPGYEGGMKTYGGLFGGAIAGVMCRYLGKVATVVILVALAIIFVLLISGEAILAYIREAKDRPKKVKEKPDGKNGDDEENDDIYVNDRFMRDEPEFRKRIRLQSPVVIEKVPDRRDPDDDFLLFE